KPPEKKTARKDPAKPTRAKAAREPLLPIAPALAQLLNPALTRGTAGVGSQTGLEAPRPKPHRQSTDGPADEGRRIEKPRGRARVPRTESASPAAAALRPPRPGGATGGDASQEEREGPPRGSNL